MSCVFDFDMYMIHAPGGAAGSNKSLDITNNCAKTLWLFVSSRSGDSAAAPDNTGLPELAPGASLRMPLPSVWSGRIWGQTDCGGCSGASCHDCAGGNAAAAAPPATIALFSIGGNQCTDFYAVSLVQGYNLPMLVAPDGGCTPVACVADQINSECPAELRVMSAAGTGAVACKSACLAFGAPQDCCTGDYGRPDTCRPSTYSEFFKKACPQAITYAYVRRRRRLDVHVRRRGRHQLHSYFLPCSHDQVYTYIYAHACPSSPARVMRVRPPEGGARKCEK